jgi:phospholipid/cholesterol/gamma-HCH transport system ATP-binding protein
VAFFEIRGVTKSFGSTEVLTGIDLDIHSGEVLTVIGVSGSGKSLLMKMLLGLQSIDAGTIHFDGELVSELREREWTRVRRRVGIMFQEPALFDSMTVKDNVAYGLREQRELAEPQIAERVTKSLVSVGLPNIEHQFPKELSGGMQKRVALARAIAVRPEMVIYDEPTEGLDPINVTRVDRLLLSLRDQLGITTVIVTHNVRSAFKMSDRIAFLHGGKVALEGPPSVFRDHESDDRFKHFVRAATWRPPTS